MLSRTLRLPAATTEAELLALLDEPQRRRRGRRHPRPAPAARSRSPSAHALDRIAPRQGRRRLPSRSTSAASGWTSPGSPPHPRRHRRPARAQAASPLAGKPRVIVGRSAIVGKPMAALLLRENCTVTVCHSRTADLAAVTREADILVAAIGRAGHDRPGARATRGAVVIDVGINRLRRRRRGRAPLPRRRGAPAPIRVHGADDPDRRRRLHPRGAEDLRHHPGARRRRTADRRHAHGQHPEGRPAAGRACRPPATEGRTAELDARSLRVGLTGGLASGKSTVAGWLRDAGFLVIDADRLVAELYQPGGEGAAAVRDLLGPGMLNEQGGVDPRQGRGASLRRPRGAGALETAIHPLVRNASTRSRRGHRGSSSSRRRCSVEAGYAPDFDLIVTVECDAETRLRRAVARGMNEDAARARLLAQGEGEGRRRRRRRRASGVGGGGGGKKRDEERERERERGERE